MKYEIKPDKTHEPKSVNAYIIIKPRKIDYWKAQLITIALSTSNLIGYKTRVGKSCLGIIGGDVWNNLKTHVSSGLPDTSWEAQTKIFQLSFLLFINVIMQTLKFREAFHYNQASSTETLDLIIFRHKNHVSTTQWVLGVRPRSQTGHSSAWPQAWRICYLFTKLQLWATDRNWQDHSSLRALNFPQRACLCFLNRLNWIRTFQQLASVKLSRSVPRGKACEMPDLNTPTEQSRIKLCLQAEF